MSDSSQFPYLHGFSPEEQQRLRQQARFHEHVLFREVDFTKAAKVLEVGCGVGAQSEILLRRFPDIHLTGIDANTHQLKTAQDYLGTLPYAKDRFTLKSMDAMSMDFEANAFDGAYLCWVLEHIPNPARVLSEVRRVLRPGSRVYLREVMNSTFFVDPYSPNVIKYWNAFNDYQYEQAGDPFVGAKLGNLLAGLGYEQINTKVFTWHLDNRHPVRRKEMFDYWLELMLSGATTLKESGAIDEKTIQLAMKEMNNVKKDPNAVFLYSFMQAEATVGLTS